MTFVCHTVVWIVIAAISEVVSQDKSRSSIFDNKPIRVQDYGTPPATSTIPLYDCSSSHRPRVDIPAAFEVYHDKQWYLQSCDDGLTWNQTMCRCELPNGHRHVVQCRDYRATDSEPNGKYEQLVNGQWIVRDCSLAVAGLVWDQEACQCVWGPGSKEMVTGQGIAPCEIMLNITFENGVKDEAKGSYVEVGRGKPVSIIAVSKPDTVDGYKAGYFTDTALNIWYFAGNEMGTSLRVEFRFKMTNDAVQRDKYQIFLSNGCNVSSPGYNTPSIAIGYRAADQSYLLAFETTSARKAIVCTRKLGTYEWHTISLIYEDGTLLFRVDDNPCIISQDFSGPIQKTPCPLTIGADPLERESMYKGFLDNILIARYCRRFMDTDPTEHTDKVKGPMPVETAPNVVDGSGGSLRKTGKSSRHVTSTKYFSHLPSLASSAGQHSDRTNQGRGFARSSRSVGKTSGSSDGSFRGSVKQDGGNYDYSSGQRSRQDQVKEFSEQREQGRSEKKTSGSAPVYSNDEKSAERSYDDGYSENVGVQKSDTWKPDDSGEFGDGYEEVSKNRGNDNGNDGLEKNSESDHGRSFSGQESDKGGDSTGKTYVDDNSRNSGKKLERSSGHEAQEKGSGYVNKHSDDNKRIRNSDETQNEFTYSDLNSRSNDKFDTQENGKSKNGDIPRISQQNGDNRGHGSWLGNSGKGGGDDGDFENSRGKERDYKGSRNSDHNVQDNVQKNKQTADGHSRSGKVSENRDGVDNFESNGKKGNTNSGKVIGYVNNDDNSDTGSDYPGPGKRGQSGNGRVSGFKDDSSLHDNEDDNVDYVSPDVDTNDDTENEDDQKSKEQNKRKEDLKNKDGASGRNKNNENWENDEYEKERNAEPESGKNRQYQTGQNNKYRDGQSNENGRNKEYESGQNRQTGQNKDSLNRQIGKVYQTSRSTEQQPGQGKNYGHGQNTEQQPGQDKNYGHGQNTEHQPGQSKNYGHGQNTEHQPGQSKNYGHRQNTEYDNKQNNEYVSSERSKRSDNTKPVEHNDNWQPYKGNIDAKQVVQSEKDWRRPNRKAEHLVQFERTEKVALGIHPTTQRSPETKFTKLPSSRDSPNYKKPLSGNRSRNGNKNTESLDLDENEANKKIHVKDGGDKNKRPKPETKESVVEDTWTETTTRNPNFDHGANPIYSVTAGNLVKGNRRFGSKKRNWYDKADSTQEDQERSLNLDLIDRRVGKLSLRPFGAESGSKVVMESRARDEIVTRTRPHLRYSNGKSNQDETRRGDDRNDSSLKQVVPRQRKESGRPSVRDEYVVKEGEEKHRTDYGSSVGADSEDENRKPPSGSLDERTSGDRAHGEAYTNNNNGPANKQTQKSAEDARTSSEAKSTSEKRIESPPTSSEAKSTSDKLQNIKPEAHGNGEDNLGNQIKTTIPPVITAKGNLDQPAKETESDKSLLDQSPHAAKGTSSHPDKLVTTVAGDKPLAGRHDMPVDVTKIKTSDHVSGTTVERDAVSSPQGVTARTTPQQKVKL